MTQNISRRTWLSGATASAIATGFLLPKNGAFAQSFMQPNLNPTRENPIRAHINENPYGQSLKARKAMADAASQAHNYADRFMPDLAKLVAKIDDIPAEYSCVGAGSTEFLSYAAMFNAIEGGDVLLPSPSYETIYDYCASLGSKLIEVPVTDDMQIDLDAMRRAMTNNTKLIYLCNPNNPIPTIIEKNALKDFCREMSQKATIFIDEAYFEYVDDKNYESMISLVKENRNIMVARTASKIHAFAGIRVGICYAHPDIIRKLTKVSPIGMSLAAIRGATESYQDKDYQNFIKKKTDESKKIIYAMLDDFGFDYMKSNTNFVFFNAGRPSIEVAQIMKKHHILTGREFKAFPNWVRLSMTKPEEMRYFVEKYRMEFT